MAKYIETDIGKEKQCVCCKEYFPATKEFFYGEGKSYKNGAPKLNANCKDCYKQKFKPWVKRCYDVAYRYEVA